MESGNNDTSEEISERRRQIFERTKVKFAAAGIELNDLEYLALIKSWIEGEITMPMVATQWDEIKKRRIVYAKSRPSAYHSVDLDRLPKMTQEQILAEIAKLSD